MQHMWSSLINWKILKNKILRLNIVHWKGFNNAILCSKFLWNAKQQTCSDKYSITCFLPKTKPKTHEEFWGPQQADHARLTSSEEHSLFFSGRLLLLNSRIAARWLNFNFLNIRFGLMILELLLIIYYFLNKKDCKINFKVI